MEQLAKMVIDIEGPAFQAYYHPECADSVRRTLKIYRADLKRRGLL
jgi:hypothetical protein